jgi:hypothetical protein
MHSEGSPGTDIPGPADSVALEFNGTNQGVFVPDSPSLAPTGSFSLVGWVKFLSLPGAVKLIAAKQGSYSFSIDASNKLRWFLTNDNNSALVTTNGAISANTWYHLTGVHDSVNDLTAIYLDGVLDQQATYTQGVETGSQPLRFAGFSATTIPSWISSVTNGGTGTSITCNAPASIGTGDMLLAHITTADQSSFSAVPTGWILIGDVNSSTTMRTRIYYKIATGSEPGSYTWTGAGNSWLIAISRLTGVDAVAPFANPCYGGATASGTIHSTGTHTPSIDNNHVLAFFAERANGTWGSYTTGTERYDTNGGGGFGSIAMCSLGQATASSLSVSGTCTTTAVGSAFMVVLNGTGLAHTAVTLGDFAFLNRALPAGEVASLFLARLSG